MEMAAGTTKLKTSEKNGRSGTNYAYEYSKSAETGKYCNKKNQQTFPKIGKKAYF